MDYPLYGYSYNGYPYSGSTHIVDGGGGPKVQYMSGVTVLLALKKTLDRGLGYFANQC